MVINATVKTFRFQKSCVLTALNAFGQHCEATPECEKEAGTLKHNVRPSRPLSFPVGYCQYAVCN